MVSQLCGQCLFIERNGLLLVMCLPRRVVVMLPCTKQIFLVIFPQPLSANHFLRDALCHLLIHGKQTIRVTKLIQASKKPDKAYFLLFSNPEDLVRHVL